MKKYVLIAKTKKETIKIDWTKISLFKNYSKEKYKLQKIDFFCSHYKNQDELLYALAINELLTLKQLNSIKSLLVEEITSAPKKNKDILIKTPKLQNELIYNSSQKYLLNDYNLIRLLCYLINDFEFISQLYNHYVTNGIYNPLSVRILSSRIDVINQKIEEGFTNLQGKKIGLIRERNNLDSSLLALTKMYIYSETIHNGRELTLKEENLVETYVEEFFTREKYYVTGCKQGNYEKNIFEYRRNKNKEKIINQLQFHNLLIFIQNYLNEKKEKEQAEYSFCNKKKNPSKSFEIPGQLSLF